MTTPSIVATTKLEESSAGTSHALSGFDTQNGDVLYAVWCISGIVDPAFNGWGVTQYWKYQDPYHSGSNTNMTVVRTIVTAADTTEHVLTMTTTSAVVAAVAIQIRGAGSEPNYGTVDKSETLPAWSSNPAVLVHPGLSQSDSRIPTRDNNASNFQVDSRVIDAFARVGTATFDTTLSDAYGGLLAHGAPYLRDQNRINGGETLPFTHADHATSTAGGLTCQVGMAHRAASSGKWGGHPNWDTYVYTGQILASPWKVNANNAAAVPTALFGLRVKGT